MLPAILAVALGSAEPLTLHQSGPSAFYTLYPLLGSRRVTFVLDPSADTTVPPYAIGDTVTLENGTDSLTIRDYHTTVSIRETLQQPVLGGDALANAPTWGVCDRLLYTAKMPRVCYRGTRVTITCEIHQCPVSFLASQHTISDCAAPLVIGQTVVMPTPCIEKISVNGETLAAVKRGDSQRVSVHQLGAALEYDPARKELSVWIQKEDNTHTQNVVSTALLLVFLSLWVTWTGGLNQAVFNQNIGAINELWNTIAWSGMITFDAVFFAASVKIWYLFSEAEAFAPKSVDMTYGHTFSEWYSQIFVLIAAVLASVVAIILLIMIETTSARSVPAFAKKIVAPGVAASKSSAGKTAIIVFLRWSVEFIVLTAIHVVVPPRLGSSFQNAIGIGAGLAIALITGRDLCIIISHTKRGVRDSTVALAAVICALYAVVHVSVFMVHPTFGTTHTLTPDVSVACSWSITIQAVSVGNILCHRSMNAAAFGAVSREQI